MEATYGDATAKVESADYWFEQISAAASETRQFRDNGRDIVARYLDKRAAYDENLGYKVNLFTTNVDLMQALLYSRHPKPFVDRVFEDYADDVARIASIMLERVLVIQERSDADKALAQAVFDRLTPGLGQVWLRYCPEIEHCQVEATYAADGQLLTEAFEYDRVISETIATDYVQWDDFFWSPARTWCEVWWVARRLWMTKADVEKKWGKQAAEAMQYARGRADMQSRNASNSETIRKDQQQYAQIYEIWCKRSKTVKWIGKGYDQILEKIDDPLELQNFYPCPEPLRSVHSNSSVIPRADYTMAKDIYGQYDMLNARINLLIEAVRVAGVYDKQCGEVASILSNAGLNQMIPVDNWAMFAEKGGVKGQIDWFPLEMVVSALDKLRIYRQDALQQIYEITGMSDIIRGSTKASETLGAQELKAQFASMRLQAIQMSISNFVEAMLNIRYEIMAKRFSDQSWVVQANMEYLDDPAIVQLLPQAIALLRSPARAKFRINVTADQLAIPDFNAERDARVGFMRALGGFIEQVAPIIQSDPTTAPFFLKMIQWVTASFRSGRTVEGILDQAIAQMQQSLSQPKPPPQPSPEEQQAQMEQQKMQQEMAQSQQEFQLDMASKQMDLAYQQKSLQMDQQKQAADIQAKYIEKALQRLIPVSKSM
jgi:hypothetical protein